VWKESVKTAHSININTVLSKKKFILHGTYDIYYKIKVLYYELNPISKKENGQTHFLREKIGLYGGSRGCAGLVLYPSPCA
jgi:hypothetical protein